jgi:mono/diheme cytochrome c family protein
MGVVAAVALGLRLPLLAPPAAAQAGDTAAAAAGEAAYARACARCHSDPRAIGGRAARLDDAARRAALERFLAHHHAPDAATRAAIVAWMAEATR